MSAKTGTMRAIGALSGYIHHPDPALGEVAFSLVVNNAGRTDAAALRAAIDAIVVAVSSLSTQGN